MLPERKTEFFHLKQSKCNWGHSFNQNKVAKKINATFSLIHGNSNIILRLERWQGQEDKEKTV